MANKGLLLVTMEPAAAAEDEFNDWYDTEHFPQLAAARPGFQSASRSVCIEGWPRYVAIYDLEVRRRWIWTLTGRCRARFRRLGIKRVLPRTIGRKRVVAEQVIPGDAVTVGPARVSRLLVGRYSSPADEALAVPFRPIPGLMQVRVFQESPVTAWVLAQFDRPILEARWPSWVAPVRTCSISMRRIGEAD